MNTYLNKNHSEKSYHCGRLLAVLAFAQDEALGTVNAGVVRRFLGAVMASPSRVLPRLQKNAEVAHYHKCDGHLGEFLRDQTKDISCKLEDEPPRVLDPQQQGIFLLGFYQQECWLEATKPGLRSRIRTKQGDWVRSRGEERVANLLHSLGVPYIYEVRVLLLSGSERWPDFYVAGRTPEKDVYIEFLGMDLPEYNLRWDDKLIAYRDGGIAVEGGARGRLIVLDYRQPNSFNEIEIRRSLGSLVAAEADESTSQQHFAHTEGDTSNA